MEEKNGTELMAGESQIKQILAVNEYSEQYGLSLSREDTELLLTERRNVLKRERRVEFGQSILPQIIYTFCDSFYIIQDNYLDVLIRLQEIFFLYKNEMQDEITDEELLNFMKEQFDGVCCGDPDYLEGTCLDIFADVELIRVQRLRKYMTIELLPRSGKADLTTSKTMRVLTDAAKR